MGTGPQSFGAKPPRILLPLTGLRGVAALWVMLYHIFDGIPIINRGYLGVDVFFLLSGFVLSHVYLGDIGLHTRRGYLRFLCVRLARIYPLHVFTLGCLVLMVIGLPDFVGPYHRGADRFSAGSLVANLFLMQDWGFWFPANWNTPSWSLSIEWLAYIVFPFLLVPLRHIASTPLLIAAAVASLISMIALLYLAGDYTFNGTGLSGAVRMGGEFTAGCCLYAAFARGWHIPAVPGLCLMLALVVGGLLLHLPDCLLVFGFALMVVLAAQADGWYARFLEWRPSLFLGEISFSVYLTHWIVVQGFNWWGDHGLTWSGWMVKSSIILIILMVSLATYHFVEVPARKWGRRLAMEATNQVNPAVAAVTNSRLRLGRGR